MIRAVPRLAGFTAELSFQKAKPFSKEYLDDIAIWLTDPDTGFGLRPEQLRVRHTDIMFDYELTAVLFNGNGMLRYNSRGATLNATGARTVEDIRLLQDAVFRFIQKLGEFDPSIFSISANAFAQTESTEARNHFLEQFRLSEEAILPGTLAYLKLPEWPYPIRVALEGAVSDDDNLFLAWSTRIENSTQWPEMLETLPHVFVRSAKCLNVSLEHDLPPPPLQ